MGAVKVLQGLFPQPGRLQFIFADLGDQKYVSSFMLLKLLVPFLLMELHPKSSFHLTGSQVNKIFAENAFDAVMHFAVVAYVGESTLEHLR